VWYGERYCYRWGTEGTELKRKGCDVKGPSSGKLAVEAVRNEELADIMSRRAV